VAVQGPLVNARDPPHLPGDVKVLLLTLSLLAGCGAPAGRGASRAPGESYEAVGFVDMGRIIRETRAGRQVLARLADAERQVTDQLADAEAALETIVEDLEAEQASETPDRERLARLADEYRAASEEAERLQALGRQQLEEYRTELTVPLLEEVRQVCEDIGRQERYALIVDRTAVAFAVHAVDLTDRVIDEIGGSAGSLVDEALRAPAEDPPPDDEAPADPDPSSSEPEPPE
jgi:Skp family chaperone for outer membrane proteins